MRYAKKICIYADFYVLLQLEMMFDREMESDI